MKLLTVFGTRPEIIRLSLLIQRLEAQGIKNVLVHTGQNYDSNLSRIFFKELGIRKPNYHLGIRKQTVGAQIGAIIERTENILLQEKPDHVLVLGDTNSGLAAIAAARHRITVLHMEAGNRCFDWSVPEEINRKIIDHVSDWLFPYTRGSRDNLLAEGIAKKYIIISGNPITEILNNYRANIAKSKILETLKIKSQGYIVATVHREENVDYPRTLKIIVRGLNLVAGRFKMTVIFSVHPRTKQKLRNTHIAFSQRIRLFEPFGFFDFARLEREAFCVMTDSGTVQEECSILKVPTVTIRETTERPETIACGSNCLSGTRDPKKILQTVIRMAKVQRDWVSPYARDLHVSEKMANFIVHHKPSKRNRMKPYARTPHRRDWYTR